MAKARHNSMHINYDKDSDAMIVTEIVWTWDTGIYSHFYSFVLSSRYSNSFKDLGFWNKKWVDKMLNNEQWWR